MRMDRLKQIKQSLESNPNDAKSHWQYGCMLGFCGNWEESFKELEWRFLGHKKTIRDRQQYPKPTWDGSFTKLLIYQDQGLGDLFQYVRYLHEIPCPYILEVAPQACRLMQAQCFSVMCRGDPLPNYAYEQVVAVCSLPMYFNKIADKHPYLRTPQSNKFVLEGNEKKIGIVWAGNPEYYNDINRSCKPSEFIELADCGQLISLMMYKTDCPFVDFSFKIKDFADTAEIISQLDCVVTVDTAVGHLAGALGKPVYLALAYEHDWRWGNEETTPWYKTMRLFRQPKKGDWNSVFQEIKNAIQQ